MTLDIALQTVEASTASDWHIMGVHTIYGWEWGQNKQGNYLEPMTHSKLAVYKPEIDISLAMDATVVDPFVEPWVQRFPNQHAASVAVQLRFRGSVVYEWIFVAVDGARYLLPMPDRAAGGGYQVPHTKMPLARLLFQLYGVGGAHPSADAALTLAGVAIV